MRVPPGLIDRTDGAAVLRISDQEFLFMDRHS
jgi:hypothetical protein